MPPRHSESAELRRTATRLQAQMTALCVHTGSTAHLSSIRLSESATSRRSGQPSLDDLLTPNLHRRSAPPPCRTPLLPPYSYISRGTSVGSFTSEMSSDDSAYHTRSPLQGAFQGTRRSQDRMRPTHQVSRQSDADSPRTPSPTAPPLPLSPCTATYTSAAQLSTRRRALQPLLPTDQAVVSEHELVLRRAGSKRTADKHVVCRAIPVRRSFSDSGRNSPALGLKALDAMSTYGPADDTHDEVEVEMQVADNHKMNAVAQSDPAVLGGSPHTPRTSSYLQTTGADLGASPNLQTPDISPGVAHVRNFRMRTDATESPLCTLSEHPLYVTNYSIPSVHAVSVATSESVSAAGATDPAVQEMPIKSRPNFLYKPAQHSSVRHKQAGLPFVSQTGGHPPTHAGHATAALVSTLASVFEDSTQNRVQESILQVAGREPSDHSRSHQHTPVLVAGGSIGIAPSPTHGDDNSQEHVRQRRQPLAGSSSHTEQNAAMHAPQNLPEAPQRVPIDPSSPPGLLSMQLKGLGVASGAPSTAPHSVHHPQSMHESHALCAGNTRTPVEMARAVLSGEIIDPVVVAKAALEARLQDEASRCELERERARSHALEALVKQLRAELTATMQAMAEMPYRDPAKLENQQFSEH